MSTRETPSLIDRRNVLKLLGAAGTWSALVPTMAAAQSDISRFRIRVSDDDLADLRRRLSNVRWPVEATGQPWAMGTDLAYLKQLVTYWRDKYQWRVHEAALNAFDHYVTTIDGQLIHFVHQKSRHPNATPNTYRAVTQALRPRFEPASDGLASGPRRRKSAKMGSWRPR